MRLPVISCSFGRASVAPCGSGGPLVRGAYPGLAHRLLNDRSPLRACSTQACGPANRAGNVPVAPLRPCGFGLPAVVFVGPRISAIVCVPVGHCAAHWQGRGQAPDSDEYERSTSGVCSRKHGPYGWEEVSGYRHRVPPSFYCIRGSSRLSPLIQCFSGGQFSGIARNLHKLSAGRGRKSERSSQFGTNCPLDMAV